MKFPFQIVEYVEQQIAAGDLPNACTCDGAVKEIDSKFMREGWTLFIDGKGRFLHKGSHMVFVRSQGECGLPIVQWQETKPKPPDKT